MILTCHTCRPHCQDVLYGPKRRVHAESGKTAKGFAPSATCTVCGNERPIHEQTVTVKAKVKAGPPGGKNPKGKPKR